MSYFSDLDIRNKENLRYREAWQTEYWENFGENPTKTYKRQKHDDIRIDTNPSTHVLMYCRKCNVSKECDLPETDDFMAFKIEHWYHGNDTHYS